MLNENNKQKPKLTPIRAIRKLLISYDIKLDDEPPIYYAWDRKRQPRWININGIISPEHPHITVDYDQVKREWYIGYIINLNQRYFATIDDITGRCDIESI